MQILYFPNKKKKKISKQTFYAEHYFKNVGLERFKFQSISLNPVGLATMLKSRMEIGHVFHEWNTYNADHLLYRDRKRVIFNYKTILLQFRRVVGLLVNMFEQSPLTRFLLVNGSPLEFDVRRVPLFRDGLKDYGEVSLLRWLPGSLSNHRYLYNFWKQKKYLNVNNWIKARWYGAVYSQAVKFDFYPDFLIALSIVGEFNIMIREFYKKRIPSIGVVDSNAEPNFVTYPLHGNDDVFSGACVYLGVLRNCINHGKNLSKFKLAKINLHTSRRLFLLKMRKVLKQRYSLFSKYWKNVSKDFLRPGDFKREERRLIEAAVLRERKKVERKLERERAVSFKVEEEDKHVTSVYSKLDIIHRRLSVTKNQQSKLEELHVVTGFPRAYMSDVSRRLYGMTVKYSRGTYRYSLSFRKRGSLYS